VDADIDVEGDEDNGETFEEYEWAGQKRVRASSLLSGGYVGKLLSCILFKLARNLIILSLFRGWNASGTVCRRRGR
jgi:hypothetical protein